MRFDQYVVMLDACVLVPMPLCDTLLRLASEPAFYTPKWSHLILNETERTLSEKLGRTPEQARRRITVMQNAFPDALVEGFADLIPSMKNDAKDRHVLAAAVKCGAHAILTDNKRHFPPESLAPYNIECLTADQFIEDQYHLDEDAFIAVLTEQAVRAKMSLPYLISKHVPCLRRLIVTKCEDD